MFIQLLRPQFVCLSSCIKLSYHFVHSLYCNSFYKSFMLYVISENTFMDCCMISSVLRY